MFSAKNYRTSKQQKSVGYTWTKTQEKQEAKLSKSDKDIGFSREVFKWAMWHMCMFKMHESTSRGHNKNQSSVKDYVEIMGLKSK